MQHIVDKGLFFSLLDSRYSGSVAERGAILLAMRAASPNVFRDSGTLNGQGTPHAGAAMGGTDIKKINCRMEHLYQHWFGYDKANPNVPIDQQFYDWAAPAQSNLPVTTGWWSRWNGDAFNIFRTTLIRAIEVSLGLEVGQPPPGTRDWPMDFLWICGAPKFEGWVSWRKHGSTGWVNVIMVTPSIGADPPNNVNAGISLSLTQGVGTVHGTPDYEEIDPLDQYSPPRTPTAQKDHGLWVIGHEFSQVEVEPGTFPSQPSQDDDWLVDESERWGTVSGWPHQIMTVQPAEEDGGRLIGGRSWP